MIKFIIDHIDPLGQGVFKQDDQVYFIPKTLPGEEGYLKVLKRSKGVNFCEAIEITKKSPIRTQAECPHFEKCNGCHFQHTSYENELNFKLTSYKRLLSQIDLANIDINIIKSPKRLNYRNRIQLHYHKPSGSLGFKTYKSSRILNIPHCQLLSEPGLTHYQELQNNWKSKKVKTSGHVEIYSQSNETKINWNKNYAEGGFTQVNEAVNLEIQNLVNSWIKPNSKVLDLFGGNGNLTRNIAEIETLHVDLYPDQRKNNTQYHLNLFEETALDEFSSNNATEFNHFVIDPPRAGFKYLANWSNHYRPQEIDYISCNPSTMVRDIQNILGDYKIQSVYLIDLFPNTYHYEAAIKLTRF